MGAAAGALAGVRAAFQPEQARADTAATPARLARAARHDAQFLPVHVVVLRQVQATRGAEGDVVPGLPIQPLALTTDFPAALSLAGLPRQEILEIGVVVVTATDAAALNA